MAMIAISDTREAAPDAQVNLLYRLLELGETTPELRPAHVQPRAVERA